VRERTDAASRIRHAGQAKENELTPSRIPRIAAAAALAFCAAATGQVLSRSDYQAREQAIVDLARSDAAACAALTGQPEAVCLAEAQAVERIARADLAARYRPSAKARHHALVVAADSRHAVARVRCQEHSGVARNTCIAAATTQRKVARDAARALLNTAEANARASAQSDEDREEASSDTFAARYAAARQQCDVYVDRLKDLCLSQTRAHFLRPQPDPVLP
jgi:hypothetical protein